MPEGEQFLHKKFNQLASSKEVMDEQLRQRERKSRNIVGAEISQKPDTKIEAWLNILKRTHMSHLDKDHSNYDPRVSDRIKNYYHNLIITPYKDKLARAAAGVEERAARTLGIEVRYEGEQLDQRGDIAIKDLTQSLDGWLDYLSSSDQTYPMWFRYYVFTNIIQLGDFDKGEEKFPKRTKDTFRLFPEIDRGALAHIQDIIMASQSNESLENIRRAQKMAGTPEKDLLTYEQATQFANRSFADQYKEAIKLNGEITPEMRAETRGEWIKYNKGSDPIPLWKSLQNKGTAWCTKGLGTAQTQLEGGDFYTYYTLDKTGNPTVPRIAIRMQGDDIFEVRGVADKDQNLEGNMIDIAEEKLQTLPNPEKYKKQVANMRKLTEIETKSKKGGFLDKQDLHFLYEIDSKIKGFGYEDDPRIKEIRETRNSQEDILMVFECTPNQIAYTPAEINQETKVFIGKLEPGIFQLTQKYGIENIYTKFPEGKIQRYNIRFVSKSGEELENEIESKNNYVDNNAKTLLRGKDFSKNLILGEKKEANLVRLTVADLDFPNGATTDEIYKRADELGLDLCEAEIGPQLQLQSDIRDWTTIAMEQITNSYGGLGVFALYSDAEKLKLHMSYAKPDRFWFPNNHWVFSIRQSSGLEGR